MYKNTNNWRTVRLGAIVWDTKDCENTQIKSTILSYVMNCVSPFSDTLDSCAFRFLSLDPIQTES